MATSHRPPVDAPEQVRKSRGVEELSGVRAIRGLALQLADREGSFTQDDLIGETLRLTVGRTDAILGVQNIAPAPPDLLSNISTALDELVNEGKLRRSEDAQPTYSPPATLD